MIKPIHSQFDNYQPTIMSAAKPRSGLRSIGDLIPRLIRSYELQAEALRQQEDRIRQKSQTTRQPETIVTCIAEPNQQTTFAWYETN